MLAPHMSSDERHMRIFIKWKICGAPQVQNKNCGGKYKIIFLDEWADMRYDDNAKREYRQDPPQGCAASGLQQNRCV